MSKGTRVMTFRIPPEVEADMMLEILSRNHHAKEAPWSTTDYIVKALREKIAHAKRSRRKKGDVK